jgi:hypothetical protein
MTEPIPIVPPSAEAIKDEIGAIQNVLAALLVLPTDEARQRVLMHARNYYFPNGMRGGY